MLKNSALEQVTQDTKSQLRSETNKLDQTNQQLEEFRGSGRWRRWWFRSRIADLNRDERNYRAQVLANQAKLEIIKRVMDIEVKDIEDKDLPAWGDGYRARLTIGRPDQTRVLNLYQRTESGNLADSSVIVAARWEHQPPLEPRVAIQLRDEYGWIPTQILMNRRRAS